MPALFLIGYIFTLPASVIRDKQFVIDEIRRLRVLCYSDGEICRQLHMNNNTYLQYKRAMLAQANTILGQRSAEYLFEELQTVQTRLERKLRELQHLIDDEKTKPKEKIDAFRLQRDIILDIARLQVEMPDVITEHKLKFASVDEQEEKEQSSSNNSEEKEKEIESIGDTEGSESTNEQEQQQQTASASAGGN